LIKSIQKPGTGGSHSATWEAETESIMVWGPLGQELFSCRSWIWEATSRGSELAPNTTPYDRHGEVRHAENTV
jgi:hypothetical protein